MFCEYFIHVHDMYIVGTHHYPLPLSMHSSLCLFLPPHPYFCTIPPSLPPSLSLSLPLPSLSPSSLPPYLEGCPVCLPFLEFHVSLPSSLPHPPLHPPPHNSSSICTQLVYTFHNYVPLFQSCPHITCLYICWCTLTHCMKVPHTLNHTPPPPPPPPLSAVVCPELYILSCTSPHSRPTPTPATFPPAPAPHPPITEHPPIF